MTYFAAALLVALVLSGLALYRQGISHQMHVERIRAANDLERSSLLDRIQHPTVRQVEPAHYDPPEPPKDAGELAMVGQVVPEFVHVGTEAPIESAHQNP